MSSSEINNNDSPWPWTPESGKESWTGRMSHQAADRLAGWGCYAGCLLAVVTMIGFATGFVILMRALLGALRGTS